MNRGRIRRSKDFDVRIAGGAEAVGLGNTRYIAVHPFADELALLGKLGTAPEECCAVDAYWSAQGDVLFVQVVSAASDPTRPLGQYWRWDSSHQHAILFVVVPSATITRSIFEAELLELLKQGVVGRAMSQARALGEKLRPV